MSSPAEFENKSTISVDPSGDTVVYDIDLSASAECNEWTNGSEGCSNSDTSSAIWTVYDLKIERAGTYRIEVDLTCTDTFPLTLPIQNVTVGWYRVDSGGTAVLSHRDFSKAKIFETTACDSSNAGDIDVTFEVDEPLVQGATDRLTVYVVTAMAVSADPEEGRDASTTTMTGTVRLREVPN